ncbi:peptidoglycan-binding domain-containing protein [Phycobacter sp. K97]|uniref:peptidoglycan-binding domain-containing protein n=1 Tax=Phycobacter sedimenti TaxID=3133977 RepID=UPI00311DEC56
MIRPFSLLHSACALGLLVLAPACTPPADMDRAPSQRTAPPDAPPGTCWDRHVRPAIIETVTVQVLVQPEQRDAGGALIQPAVFRTETRQDIVRPRSESWLEITCPVDMTPDFIASLQRALTVRGHYTGPVTGQMDRPTRRAVLRYQRGLGLESQQLSLDSARRLGLISVPR